MEEGRTAFLFCFPDDGAATVTSSRQPSPPAADAPAALFAEVAVNSAFPHRQTFSYGVPAGLDVHPGHAVYVPFGRQTLQGIVLDVHTTPAFSEPEKIRPVASPKKCPRPRSAVGNCSDR